MIQEQEFDRLETEPLDDVVQLLEGRIFHVTKRRYWPAILETGAIVPNKNGALPSSFGHVRNGYFRKRGCVSLFDYRTPSTEEICEFRSRCWPFGPAMPDAQDAEIAILILKRGIESQLISWQQWKDEKAHAEVVVPYVEAGHPGPVPISAIEQVIFVRLREDPACYAAAFRNARNKASQKVRN